MPTAAMILAELEKKGSEKTRKTYARHGTSTDRTYGVSVADLKTIAKTIKGQQALACEIYDSGKFEAMYLAGLVARGDGMTKQQLDKWAEAAAGMQMISEYTVPWVAVESSHGRELANKWIKSDKEHVACSGWCTYAGILATKPDETLDFTEIQELLKVVERGIKNAPNRVRYTMNGFVIAVGSYVAPLLSHAKATAARIGVVSVDMGDTACTVRLASDSIQQLEDTNRVGQKRKMIRC